MQHGGSRYGRPPIKSCFEQNRTDGPWGSTEISCFDAIILDLMLPEMDGLEASRQLNKLYPEPERPQIIAMTANAVKGDKEKCNMGFSL